MVELILMVLVMAATAAFFYWLGWDNRGDIEETRRWDSGCRCDLAQPPHWRETATCADEGDHRVLGEGEDGELYVPSRTIHGWWDRPFNPWNPTHWRYWLRSRRLGQLAFLSHDVDVLTDLTDEASR